MRIEWGIGPSLNCNGAPMESEWRGGGNGRILTMCTGVKKAMMADLEGIGFGPLEK